MPSSSSRSRRRRTSRRAPHTPPHETMSPRAASARSPPSESAAPSASSTARSPSACASSSSSTRVPGARPTASACRCTTRRATPWSVSIRADGQRRRASAARRLRSPTGSGLPVACSRARIASPKTSFSTPSQPTISRRARSIRVAISSAAAREKVVATMRSGPTEGAGVRSSASPMDVRPSVRRRYSAVSRWVLPVPALAATTTLRRKAKMTASVSGSSITRRRKVRSAPLDVHAFRAAPRARPRRAYPRPYA